jgi:hypothetical protein
MGRRKKIVLFNMPLKSEVKDKSRETIDRILKEEAVNNKIIFRTEAPSPKPEPELKKTIFVFKNLE